jgi:tetratricopeptide (TPR) repeat protein
METPPPRPRTLEEAITAALATGDEPTAAALLRRAFDRPDQRGTGDLPELLEELAEYFVSLDRYEDAIAAATSAALITSAPAEDGLRRRARVAQVLLSAGLVDEACAVYAAVAEDAPGQTWVHEAAGSDYVDAEEFELAFAWLTGGLEIAVADGQPVECVRRLCGLRRIAMMALGMPPDDLDGQGCARFSYPEVPCATAGTQTSDAEAILVADALDTSHVARSSALRLLKTLRETVTTDRTIVLPEAGDANAGWR